MAVKKKPRVTAKEVKAVKKVMESTSKKKQYLCRPENVAKYEAKGYKKVKETKDKTQTSMILMEK